MSGPAHLLVIASRYPFGTQESYLGTELAALRAHLDKITVAPLRAQDGPRRHEVPDGIDVVTLPLGGARTYLRALQTFVRSPRTTLRAQLGLALSRDGGKLKNLAIFPKALALAAWARESGVTHVHGYWLSTPATAAFAIGTIARIPWSATAHRWDIYERNALDVKAKNAAFIRTISRRGTNDLRSRLDREARVVEVRLGADIPPSAGRTFDARPRPLHVVSPAALVPVKGHADLLEGIALAKALGIDVRCTIAGQGPQRDALAAQARALRIDDAVNFAGFIPHDALMEWYRSGVVDAVALTSRDDGPAMMEGLPSALIEALAFGIPVVATDSGSIGELLTPECGYLVPPRSPERIAQALGSIYASPQRARERALRGRSRVIHLHDARTQMRAFAQLVASCQGVLS